MGIVELFSDLKALFSVLRDVLQFAKYRAGDLLVQRKGYLILAAYRYGVGLIFAAGFAYTGIHGLSFLPSSCIDYIHGMSCASNSTFATAGKTVTSSGVAHPGCETRFTKSTNAAITSSLCFSVISSPFSCPVFY